MGRHLWRTAAPLVSLVLGVVGLFSVVSSALADDAPATLGYDISWPQCEGFKTPVERPQFAIIGVNGGRAYTVNKCLKAQWAWAAKGNLPAAVYINLNHPRTWTSQSESGPAGTCRSDDDWCLAYNFGYNAAAFAVSHARSQGVSPAFWWLDVETMNYWSSDTDLNAHIIGAAIDYFRERQLPVGAYSTPYQWREIAGRYAPGLPAWTAGAIGLEQAVTRCTSKYAFAGGQVALVQYVEEFDTNYVCPGRAADAGLERPKEAVAEQVTASAPLPSELTPGLLPATAQTPATPRTTGSAFKLNPIPAPRSVLDEVIPLPFR